MNLLASEYKLFKTGIGIVFSRFHYVLLAVIFSVLVGFLFFAFTKLPGQSFESWQFSVSDVTKWFVITYSIFAGFLIAVQVYTVRHVGIHLAKTTKTAAGVLPGILSGIMSVACCAPAIVGIAALVGSGAVGFVAANQLLFAVPSILLLFVSLHYSLRAIAIPVCMNLEIALAKPKG